MKVMFRYNCPLPIISDNKVYDVISYFNIIDPMTMKPHKKYTIKCDDGCQRAFSADLFIPLEEVRDIKLNKLI